MGNYFQHPNLLAWIREQRTRLLSAARTILSAYCRARSPDQKLKPWGSFEGWSDFVRQSLVWTGLPDPGETREELARSSDREAAALRALIRGWAEIDPDGAGLTASKAIERLKRASDAFELLRSAVLELCPAPSGKLPGPRSLGNKLRHLRGRVVGGKAIDKRDVHVTAVWFITEIGQDCNLRRMGRVVLVALAQPVRPPLDRWTNALGWHVGKPQSRARRSRATRATRATKTVGVGPTGRP